MPSGTFEHDADMGSVDGDGKGDLAGASGAILFAGFVRGREDAGVAVAAHVGDERLDEGVEFKVLGAERNDIDAARVEDGAVEFGVGDIGNGERQVEDDVMLDRVLLEIRSEEPLFNGMLQIGGIGIGGDGMIRELGADGGIMGTDLPR